MDTQAQFEAVLDAQGGHEEDWLLDDPVEDREQLKGNDAGNNQTWRVYLGHTREPAYFKPLNGVQRTVAQMVGHDPISATLSEAVAWRVAAALEGPLLEIATPCVLRWIHEIDEHAPGALLAAQPRNESAASEVFFEAPILCRNAAFFDALIGHQDRHAANYLFHEGQLSLIDSGFAFGRHEQDDPLLKSIFLEWRWRDERQALENWEEEALERLISSSDLLGIGKMLDESRSASLRRRAERMLERGELVPVGDFC